jgi:hypothetical protein
VIPVPVLAALGVAVLAVGSGDGDPATSEQDLPTGGEPVALDPEEFTTRIGNPYLPMTPGDRRVYRITDSDGLRQRSVAAVTDETKRIANGVTARVVYTIVREAGKRVEDTTPGTRRTQPATSGTSGRGRGSSSTARSRPRRGPGRPASTARYPASSCPPTREELVSLHRD